MKGICLRGQPGWGQLGAPLTTVVNTFGGTWFDEDWNAQVNAQPFKDATNFYINLVKAHGEVGASTAGFTECLSAMEQSKVAMWYDATSAAGSLEAHGLAGGRQGRLRPGPGQDDQGVGLAVRVVVGDGEEDRSTRMPPGSSCPGRPPCVRESGGPEAGLGKGSRR